MYGVPPSNATQVILNDNVVFVVGFSSYRLHLQIPLLAPALQFWNVFIFLFIRVRQGNSNTVVLQLRSWNWETKEFEKFAVGSLWCKRDFLLLGLHPRPSFSLPLSVLTKILLLLLPSLPFNYSTCGWGTEPLFGTSALHTHRDAARTNGVQANTKGTAD